MTLINDRVSTTHFYLDEWDFAVEKLSMYSGVDREFVDGLREDLEGSRVGMLDMVHEVAEKSEDDLIKRVDSDKSRITLMRVD